MRDTGTARILARGDRRDRFLGHDSDCRRIDRHVGDIQSRVARGKSRCGIFLGKLILGLHFRYRKSDTVQ